MNMNYNPSTCQHKALQKLFHSLFFSSATPPDRVAQARVKTILKVQTAFFAMKKLPVSSPSRIARRVVLLLVLSVSLILCNSPKKDMTNQSDPSEQTAPQAEPDSVSQQGGGGKPPGKTAQPSQEPPRPAKEAPEPVREVPLGSPLPPTEWQRLKREAEKPGPRPAPKKDSSDGQQDPHQDN